MAVQLNWYPESEHGGVYQASADGTYRSAGLEVDIRPGGRATPVAPELQLDRVQFAMANADDVVVFRREGMDIVAVMAVMQNSPRCIMVREESGVTDFSGLAGLTLQRQAGRSFLEFMRSKGILDQVTEVPYHGSVSSMVADPEIAVQELTVCRTPDRPPTRRQGPTLDAQRSGLEPVQQRADHIGKIDPRTTPTGRQFVQATRQGWTNYLADPTAGNGAIMKANEHGMTPEALQFGVRELEPLALPDAMSVDEIGVMSIQRWTTLVNQMNELDPKSAGKVGTRRLLYESILDAMKTTFKVALNSRGSSSTTGGPMFGMNDHAARTTADAK